MSMNAHFRLIRSLRYRLADFRQDVLFAVAQPLSPSNVHIPIGRDDITFPNLCS